MMSRREHDAREGHGCAGCGYCWVVFGVGYNAPSCPACFGTGCTRHGSLIEPIPQDMLLMPEYDRERATFSIIFTGAPTLAPMLGTSGYPRAAWEIRRTQGPAPQVVKAFELLQALRVFHSRHGLPRSAASLLAELEAHRAHAKLLEQSIRDTVAGKGGSDVSPTGA
jgi:hypothetical protein